MMKTLGSPKKPRGKNCRKKARPRLLWPGRQTVRLLSFGLLLAFWSALSFLMQDPQTLPQPAEVFAHVVTLLTRGELIPHLLATAWRVVWAFALAMILGGLLGFCMGRYPRWNAWVDPWLIVFLNLPALVIIVLCYLWVGLNETAAILAVTLNKIPLVTTIIREGARNASHDLHDLAQVYRLSRWTRLRHIVWPEMYPHIVAAARAGLSVIWKIVLVVEFLGRSNGIGRQIHTQFSLFNVTGVLAYALSFVALVMCIEFLVLQPLERRARKWRQRTAEE